MAISSSRQDQNFSDDAHPPHVEINIFIRDTAKCDASLDMARKRFGFPAACYHHRIWYHWCQNSDADEMTRTQHKPIRQNISLTLISDT